MFFKMRYLIVTALLVCVATLKAEEGKQIKLEDIEHDTLIRETQRDQDDNLQKELAPQPTQHIQLSYSNTPQDVFVTPTPSGNAHYAVKDSSAEIRQQVYHLPKVHEAEETYTVPAKQSLLQPFIGGQQPIQTTVIPQPQYIYIPSTSQPHHPYVSQAHAFVMVPFVQHAPATLPTPTPTPTVYTYSHAPPSHHHQPIYHQKTIEYVPPATITPLQTQVDYKNLPTIVPKNTLPSVATTSFRQYYSPGLEYHYTEIIPATKLAPSYAYHHSPSQNYQTSYVSQPYYYPQQHQQQSSHYKNLIDSFVPNYVTYARQQQPHPHQNHQQTHYRNYNNYYSSASMPQQLFTPASAPSASHYHQASYPSQREYNTIAYSVPLPPYDHSKRSTKASVSQPKTTASSPLSSSKSSLVTTKSQ